jgi:hypothetical protein
VYVKQTLVLHWDGSSWTQVASPNTSSNDDNQFSAISAVSATDMWTVGNSAVNGSQAITAHWNGTAWALVPSFEFTDAGTTLAGVKAVASNNVWAVGGDGTGRALIERWNGTAWNVTPVQGQGQFFGVAALSGTDAWAVGDTAGGLTADTITLAEHYPTKMRGSLCPYP